MPSDTDALDVALSVARAIESVRGAYFVGGSVASSLQGEPRATNGIDIVVELPLGRLADFVAALGEDVEVDLDMLRDALLNGRTCNIIFLPAVMKVDLFGLGGSQFDEAQFARRRRVQDAAYLTGWARRLGLDALLERARRDAT